MTSSVLVALTTLGAAAIVSVCAVAGYIVRITGLAQIGRDDAIWSRIQGGQMSHDAWAAQKAPAHKGPGRSVLLRRSPAPSPGSRHGRFTDTKKRIVSPGTSELARR
jgi:hypothetical protein